MTKNAFIIALLISTLLVVSSFVSYMARRSSKTVLEPSAQPVTSQKGYDSLRKMNLTTIQSGLERYRLVRNKYPNSLKELEGAFMRTVPKDPVTKKNYEYELFNSQTYELSARMDDGSLYTVTSP